MRSSRRLNQRRHYTIVHIHKGEPVYRMVCISPAMRHNPQEELKDICIAGHVFGKDRCRDEQDLTRGKCVESRRMGLPVEKCDFAKDFPRSQDVEH